jgi:HK97 family phage major capsid protein
LTTNQSIIEKAAMKLSDLAAGGLMNTQQFNTFYRKIIDEPTILKDARNVVMTSDAMKIEKIGFGTRVLRPGVEGTALIDSDRSVPTTSTVNLNAKEVIAEVNITYDTLENNIEGNNLQDTIMTLISQRVALDLEELIINGDTASADTYLKLINGLRKQATTNVVDALGTQKLTKDLFKKAINAVPAKYRRDPSAWRFYTSFQNEMEWRDQIVARQTSLGDQAIQGGSSTAYGYPVKGIAMLQDYDVDSGTAGTQSGSDILLCHPKNIVLGFSRNVRVEVDKDIRERKFIIVITAKIDTKFEEEPAVAKIKNILNY